MTNNVKYYKIGVSESWYCDGIRMFSSRYETGGDCCESAAIRNMEQMMTTLYYHYKAFNLKVELGVSDRTLTITEADGGVHEYKFYYILSSEKEE